MREPARLVERLDCGTRSPRASLHERATPWLPRRPRSRRRSRAAQARAPRVRRGAAGSARKRLGEREGIPAAGEQPLSPLGEARQAEDGPVDGGVAEQHAPQVVAGDVLDGLGPEREAADPGCQNAVTQASVRASSGPPSRRWSSSRTVMRQIGVDRQELPGLGGSALHGLERLVAARPQTRIAGPQLRRHRRTSPGERRRRPRAARLPGLRMPAGSSTALTRRIASSSASPYWRPSA